MAVSSYLSKFTGVGLFLIGWLFLVTPFLLDKWAIDWWTIELWWKSVTDFLKEHLIKEELPQSTKQDSETWKDFIERRR